MHKVVDKYNAFKLKEYNGIYELMSGNAKDDKFYPEWTIANRYDSDIGSGVPVKKDDGSYRVLPVKVVLGTRVEAIENLRWLLEQLTEVQDSPPPDSDVPF